MLHTPQQKDSERKQRMEQTVAVITTLEGKTLCTVNTTKHSDNELNGYPFTRQQAFNLIPYRGNKVKVSIGHNHPIPTTIKTIKSRDVGKRIVKISFYEGAFKSQERPLSALRFRKGAVPVI
jgi:hypothetical protein